MTKSRNLRNVSARPEALAAGRKYYCTGIPCKNGHVANRLTSNGSCVECTAVRKSEADKQYYAKNSDKLVEYQKSYRNENKDLVKAKDKDKWFKNHEHNLELLRVRSRRHTENRRLDREFDAFMASVSDEEATSC